MVCCIKILNKRCQRFLISSIVFFLLSSDRFKKIGGGQPHTDKPQYSLAHVILTFWCKVECCSRIVHFKCAAKIRFAFNTGDVWILKCSSPLRAGSAWLTKWIRDNSSFTHKRIRKITCFPVILIVWLIINICLEHQNLRVIKIVWLIIICLEHWSLRIIKIVWLIINICLKRWGLHALIVWFIITMTVHYKTANDFLKRKYTKPSYHDINTIH